MQKIKFLYVRFSYNKTKGITMAIYRAVQLKASYINTENVIGWKPVKEKQLKIYIIDSDNILIEFDTTADRDDAMDRLYEGCQN